MKIQLTYISLLTWLITSVCESVFCTSFLVFNIFIYGVTCWEKVNKNQLKSCSYKDKCSYFSCVFPPSLLSHFHEKEIYQQEPFSFTKLTHTKN